MITHRRLYQLGDGQPRLAADGLFTGRIRIELIIEQWDELLRLAASLKRGWIVPSVLLARMSTDQRPDRTAKALREYGVVDRVMRRPLVSALAAVASPTCRSCSDS